MCVYVKYSCDETANSAESVVIRVVDQHLRVLLQPRKWKVFNFVSVFL